MATIWCQGPDSAGQRRPVHTARETRTTMSCSDYAALPLGFSPEMRAGWEAALEELQHQAKHLEERGASRAAVTLYDAIRIARAGGLNCEHARPAQSDARN